PEFPALRESLWQPISKRFGQGGKVDIEGALDEIAPRNRAPDRGSVGKEGQSRAADGINRIENPVAAVAGHAATAKLRRQPYSGDRDDRQQQEKQIQEKINLGLRI